MGVFYREGYTYGQETILVYDRVWSSLAEGEIVPHGLYDMSSNIGYGQLGLSHGTNLHNFHGVKAVVVNPSSLPRLLTFAS